MLSKAISSLTSQVNEYLKLRYRLTEDIAFVSPPIKDIANSFPANRISISVVSIEKENIGGLAHSQQTVSDKLSRKAAIVWPINAYLLIAAVFLEKQYGESVQLLSGVLSCLQKNNQHPFGGKEKGFTIELVNLSFHELSNLWSVCGGTYYPSVLCKVRGIEIDENEVASFIELSKQHDVDTNIK